MSNVLFCQCYHSSESQASCTTNSLCYVRDKTSVKTVGMRGIFICSLLDTEFEIRWYLQDGGLGGPNTCIPHKTTKVINEQVQTNVNYLGKVLL